MVATGIQRMRAHGRWRRRQVGFFEALFGRRHRDAAASASRTRRYQALIGGPDKHGRASTGQPPVIPIACDIRCAPGHISPQSPFSHHCIGGDGARAYGALTHPH